MCPAATIVAAPASVQEGVKEAAKDAETLVAPAKTPAAVAAPAAAQEEATEAAKDAETLVAPAKTDHPQPPPPTSGPRHLTPKGRHDPQGPPT